MMAGSDLARSCCFTPEAKQAYKILGESLRNGCMSKIKGGMSGDEIYWLGMEAVSYTHLATIVTKNTLPCCIASSKLAVGCSIGANPSTTGPLI